MEDGDLEIDEHVSLYELTSSDVVALENFVPQTFWRGVRKEYITLLGETISSPFKPLKQVAESGFEVPVESGETRE